MGIPAEDTLVDQLFAAGRQSMSGINLKPETAEGESAKYSEFKRGCVADTAYCNSSGSEDDRMEAILKFFIE